MSFAKERVATPVGDLEWLTISGQGKEDEQGRFKYEANLILDPEGVDEKTTEKQKKAAKEFIQAVDAFWVENKPSGFKSPKSLGYRPHSVSTGERDDLGKIVYEETGKFSVRFFTGTTYAHNGESKKVVVYNSKGGQVELGDRLISNGSRGLLSGFMAIYATKKTAGVTFYLEAVQLTKFIEYKGVTAAPVEDESVDDTGFEAFEDSVTEVSSDIPKLD